LKIDRIKMNKSHGTGLFDLKDFKRLGENVTFEYGVLVFHPENIEIVLSRSKAITSKANTTAESTPPLTPITAPLKLYSWIVFLIKFTIRSASAEGLNLVNCIPSGF